MLYMRRKHKLVILSIIIIIIAAFGIFYTLPATYEEPVILARYSISGDDIIFIDKPDVDGIWLNRLQNDNDKHQILLDVVKSTLPLDHVPQLTEIQIGTDGTAENSMIIGVRPTYENPESWILFIDIQDEFTLFGNIHPELEVDLIHEYGHLLIESADQIYCNPSHVYITEEEYMNWLSDLSEQCPTQLFFESGCAKEDSYIKQFYDRFWTETMVEWSEDNKLLFDEGLDAYYAARDDFYEEHPDDFVNNIAATDILEDMAETWAIFVLEDAPIGYTIADQKILFFYAFPEFVEIREEIRSNIN